MRPPGAPPVDEIVVCFLLLGCSSRDTNELEKSILRIDVKNTNDAIGNVQDI